MGGRGGGKLSLPNLKFKLYGNNFHFLDAGKHQMPILGPTVSKVYTFQPVSVTYTTEC